MSNGNRIVSADTHVNEPPNLWLDRLPAKYRDRAPHIEHFDQGDGYVMEGALSPFPFGKTSNAGLPPDQRPQWIRWEDVRPGGYDPAARIAEQDQDGVSAEVLYPTPRVSGQLFSHVADKDFHLACVRAYNDWLSEYASYAPDRLWGMPIIPNVGLAEALEETDRALALPGMRGALIGQYPHGGDDIAPEDDALWARLVESNTPVGIHVGFVTTPQGTVPGVKERASGAMRFFDAPVLTAQFIESGVFDRFPDLKLILAEADSSWIPYVAEQMNDRFNRAAVTARAKINRLPGEYYSTNVYSTFITDTYGIRNRDVIGVSQMMWSSDYPHTGASWPNSVQVIDAQFAGVPEDEKHAILSGNADRIYNTVS
jgi:predicted TIM-barrel fold metal-dependent hydrolase